MGTKNMTDNQIAYADISKTKERSIVNKLKKLVMDNPAFFALIVLFIFFSIVSPRFCSIYNCRNILTQISVIAIIGFGMTFVITAGEIDLSVGSVLCFSGMIFMGLSVMGVPVILGFLITLLLGAVIGLIIGVAVTYFKIPSFIVTLAAMSIFRGASLLLMGGTTISQGIQPSYFWFGQYKVVGIPVPVIILFVVFILMTFLFKNTVFGLYTRAVGSNAESSRLAGISPARVKTWIFILIGVCSALAGIITASRLGIGTPTLGFMKEMDAITAVVLGGTHFSGGIGTIPGTLVGALVVAVLSNGMTLLGISSYWQQVILGLVLVAALAMNRFKK